MQPIVVSCVVQVGLASSLTICRRNNIFAIFTKPCLMQTVYHATGVNLTE